ncbi:hypothetical protein GDO81_023056, partial [Engystomops pustulosus]
MDSTNQTLAAEFILLGFSKDLKTNIVLFMVFLLIYLVSISANGLILVLVLINSSLHIPMYFFLCILSLLDLTMTSAIIPKLLVDLISVQRIISLIGCRTQLYFVLLVGGTECLLLALMAYDRYVAICRPLHYPIVMRWSNCFRLTALVWILTFIILILPSIGKPPKLCYPNQINHFMCEALAVTQLSCENTHSSEVIVITCFLVLFIPFLFIIASYICILTSILKMKSTRSAKAFSTCTSHVTVVVLFYGTSVVMYFGPSSDYSTKYGKYFSVLTNIICPTLNPLIYCLHNKEMKEAQRKLFSRE